MRGRPKGFRCTADTRAKMSAARKAAWADPEVRAKMSAASKAALADPEVRAKMHPHLAALTPQERADYDTLKKAGYRKAEALALVTRNRRAA